MGDIRQRDFSAGWLPSVDAGNCPQSALLRADNLTLDDEGAVVVRKGSVPRNATAYSDTDVHSLHTVNLSGDMHLLAGADDKVYLNDTAMSATFAGSGDVALGNMMGQLLCTRSTSHIKHDGTTERNWGIEAPVAAPTLEAVDLITTSIADCNDPAGFSADEGAVAKAVGVDGVADTAVEVTPAATGRATIVKSLSSETDFYNFAGARGGPADLIDLVVIDTAPQDLEFIQLDLSCNGDSTDPFDTDYYTYRWEIADSAKSLALDRDEVIRAVDDRFRSTPDADDWDDPTDAAWRSEVSLDYRLASTEDRREERTAIKKRQATGTVAWTHFSVPRNRMQRIGATEGKNWTTIKAVAVTVKRADTKQGVIRFDNLTVTAGIEGNVLTGTYRCRFRRAYNSGSYVELSPPSPISEPLTVNAQAIKATIPEGEALDMDTQCNELWMYFYTELLGGFFRTPAIFNLSRAKIHVNEFADYADGSVNDDDRLRLATVGLVPGRRWTPGTTSLYPIVSELVTQYVPAVAYLYPNGTDFSDWNIGPAGAPTVHEALDDPHGSPDDAASGMSHRGPSAQIRLTLDDFDETADSITSVTVHYRCYRNKSSNDDEIVALVKVGGTNYYGTAHVPGTTFTDYSHTWTTNPDTSSAWVASDLDALIAGVQYRPQTSRWKMPLTQIYVSVDYQVEEEVSARGTVTSGSKLAFTAATSDVELLLHNRPLDPTEKGPPDDILSIVGPWAGRLFLLTESFIHPSLPWNPSSYKRRHAYRIGDGATEQGLWLAAAGGLYVGTTRDVGRLDGTWQQLPDGSLEYAVRWLNVAHPPIDNSIAQVGNTLIYHSAQGYCILSGEGATLLRGPLELLYEGQARYGVPPIDHSIGRHNAVLTGDAFLYLAPHTDRRRISANGFEITTDGISNKQDRLRRATLGLPGPAVMATDVHKFQMAKQRWERQVYPTNLRSLCRSVEGELLAGDDSGYVWRLEAPEQTSDNGTAIPIALYTAEFDNGAPAGRKRAHDLTLQTDTADTAVKAALWFDGSAETSCSPDTAVMGDYKTAVQSRLSAIEWSALGPDELITMPDKMRIATVGLTDPSVIPFRRAQLRITGDVNEFKLRSWSLAYRELPQHRMRVDTGYIPVGQNYRTFVRELRLCARTPVDLTVETYFDGTQVSSDTVTALAGTRIYHIPLARGIQGRQLRVVVSTTAAATAEELGFECYWLEAKGRPAGNATSKVIQRWTFENTPGR